MSLGAELNSSCKATLAFQETLSRMDETVPQASVSQKLARGAGWIMASRIAVNAISFASSIILARLLVPEDFGLVAIAVGVSAIAGALTTLPISEALIRLDHIEDDHFNSAFTLGLIRSVLLTIAIVLAAGAVAHAYNDDRLIPVMLALAVEALIGGFYSSRWALLQKRLSFGPAAFAGLAIRLVGSASAVLIAYYYANYWAIIIPIVLAKICNVVLTHIFAPHRLRLCFTKIPEIWGFSGWMTLSAVLRTVGTRLDSLIIGAVLGQRAAGYYSYGDDKAALPTRELSAPLLSLLFPGLAAVNSNPDRLASAYKRLQTTVFATCAPFGIGFALVSDMFVHVLLGDKWAPIIPIMQVLAVALALENLVIGAAPLAMAMGFTRRLFIRDVVVFVGRAPLIVAGALMYGIPGLLAARALALVWYLAQYLVLAKRIANIPVRDQLAGCGRSIAALTAMAVGVTLFKNALPQDSVKAIGALFATVIFGGTLYTIAHAALWLLSGRPDGPEKEVLTIVGGAVRRTAMR
jgi:lipopolysaccharide exporter